MVNNKPLAGKKVAVLVETEFISDEVEFYQHRIPELGGEVQFLAYLWGKASMDLMNDIDSPDRPITDARRLTVTHCVTEKDADEFDVVICAANYVAVRLREIPPMGSLASPGAVGDAPAVKFFAKAMTNKRIIKGAMCHALWLLTPRPDLLRNRRVICHTVVLADVINAGAVYIPATSHVVVDDDLVTARSFADVEDYFKAIVDTVVSGTSYGQAATSPADMLDKVVNSCKAALEPVYSTAAKTYDGQRPIAKAARALIDGTLDIPSEVCRLIGINLDTKLLSSRQPVLLLGSKFGVWGSELTVVAAALLRAGYKVKIATEDGSTPHLLSPSLDPSFQDGAWRASVVSPEEMELSLRFLDPSRAEHQMLDTANILNLEKSLARPPQIGDYIKNPSLLKTYLAALRSCLDIALQYDAIVIAGGSGAIPGFMFDRGLQSLILAFYKLGKPVMGECNGGLAIAQTTDPANGRSILFGRAATTHSWLDEYQSGWGWTQPFNVAISTFWKNGQFCHNDYAKEETWYQPGIGGNPLIDSSSLFCNACGPGGVFFSPPGTPYAVVVDENLITCRTTPDGYPGVLALMARLDGNPPLSGRLFIDGDCRGRTHP